MRGPDSRRKMRHADAETSSKQNSLKVERQCLGVWEAFMALSVLLVGTYDSCLMDEEESGRLWLVRAGEARAKQQASSRQLWRRGPVNE